jgi:hypothetical protein
MSEVAQLNCRSCRIEATTVRERCTSSVEQRRRHSISQCGARREVKGGSIASSRTLYQPRAAWFNPQDLARAECKIDDPARSTRDRSIRGNRHNGNAEREGNGCRCASRRTNAAIAPRANANDHGKDRCSRFARQ